MPFFFVLVRACQQHNCLSHPVVYLDPSLDQDLASRISVVVTKHQVKLIWLKRCETFKQWHSFASIRICRAPLVWTEAWPVTTYIHRFHPRRKVGKNMCMSWLNTSQWGRNFIWTICISRGMDSACHAKTKPDPGALGQAPWQVLLERSTCDHTSDSQTKTFPVFFFSLPSF